MARAKHYSHPGHRTCQPDVSRSADHHRRSLFNKGWDQPITAQRGAVCCALIGLTGHVGSREHHGRSFIATGAGRELSSIERVSWQFEPTPPRAHVMMCSAEVFPPMNNLAPVLVSAGSTPRAHAAGAGMSPTTTSTTAPGATTKRRRRTSAVPKNVTLEEKKEKNRMSVKRSYYRKIETLDELRAKTEQLRRQYRYLADLRQRKIEATAAKASSPTGVDDNKSLLDRYMELSQLRDSLWLENEHLQSSFEHHVKQSFRLQRLFDVNYQMMDHSACAGLDQDKLPLHVPMLIMEEMPHETFLGFVNDAYEGIRSFLRLVQGAKSSTILGWKSVHLAEDKALRFHMAKHFPHQRGPDVAKRIWDVLTCTKRHSELYARTLHVRFHVMQCFDENSYILYRTMEKEGEDTVTTALVVMSRMRTANGWTVICRGLKKEEHKLHMESTTEFTLQRKKIWRESMYWCSVEEKEGGGCTMAHGGIMNNIGDRSPAYWLFENLMIAMRWEKKVIEPFATNEQLLTASGSDN